MEAWLAWRQKVDPLTGGSPRLQNSDPSAGASPRPENPLPRSAAHPYMVSSALAVARQAGSAACCPQLPCIDSWLYEGDGPHLLTTLLLLYGLSIEQVSSAVRRVLEFICELKHLLESY